MRTRVSKPETQTREPRMRLLNRHEVSPRYTRPKPQTREQLPPCAGLLLRARAEPPIPRGAPGEAMPHHIAFLPCFIQFFAVGGREKNKSPYPPCNAVDLSSGLGMRHAPQGLGQLLALPRPEPKPEIQTLFSLESPPAQDLPPETRNLPLTIESQTDPALSEPPIQRQKPPFI